MQAETSTELQARRTAQVLQGATVSTKIIGCRPLVPADNATLVFSYAQNTVMNVDISINNLDQELIMRENIRTRLEAISSLENPNGAYTFVMRNILPGTPETTSRILIALAERGGCSDGAMQTPFGSIIPWVSPIIIGGLQDTPFTIAAITRNFQRTRTQYDRYASQQTSETYLSPPIFGPASLAFMYSPISAPPGQVGLGALLYQHVYPGEQWHIP